MPSWVLDAACAFFVVVGLVCMMNGAFWIGIVILVIIAFYWGSLQISRATTSSGISVDELANEQQTGVNDAK